MQASEQYASALPAEMTAKPATRGRFMIPWKMLTLSVWIGGSVLLLARRVLIALRLRAVVRRSGGDRG